MTKQIRSKRIAAVLIVIVMATTIFPLQALAANDYFSGTTGIMNSLYGSPSARWSISRTALGTNPQVTSVVLTIITKSGDPFDVYVQSPSGITVSRYVGSTSFTITDFNGTNPSGAWYVWIVTRGTVSTATASLKVNYSY